MRKLSVFLVTAAAALSAASVAFAGGGPSVSLANSPCTLTAGGPPCLFNGNINTTDLGKVDAAYNNQAGVTPIDLASTFLGEQDNFSQANQLSGTVNEPNELISFYTVKAGDQFDLFEITPSHSFTWSTADLCVGKNCNQPTISHVDWFGTTSVPLSAAPEPATWAMMILGLGMVGFAARRRAQGTFAAG